MHLLAYLISKQEIIFIYLLMKYATLTAKMKNYGQAVVVEEGINSDIDFNTQSGIVHNIKKPQKP